MYNQYSSESAGKVKKIDPKKATSNLKDRFLGRLIQNNLTEAQMDEYQSQYFPSSKFDKALGKAPAYAFCELSHYLVRIQFALDAVHCFVRDVCTSSTNLIVDSHIGQNTTAKSLKAKYEEALTLFPTLSNSKHATYSVLGSAMANVGWCVIKPSERFSGGKTIVNVPYDCGRELDGKISGAVTGFRVAMLNKKNKGWFPILYTKDYPSVMTKAHVNESAHQLDAEYQAALDRAALEKHMSTYGSMISSGALSVLASIHEDLTGAKLSTGNFKSKVASRALDFDFAKYDQMLKDSHPAIAEAIPDGGFFGWIPKPDLGNLPNILQLGFRLQPNTDIAAMLYKANPENRDSREDKVPRTARRTLEAMSDEFVIVSSQLMVGWTLDIKPEFVTYLCQGHDDKAETIIQNWMRIWIPSYFRQPGANRKAKAETDSDDIPRTGGLPSDISRVRAVRGEFGFANRDSVGDVNGVAISEDGTMYVPASYSDVDTEEVKAMETELNAALTKSASAGIPHSSLTLIPHQYIADMSDDGTYDRSKYRELNDTFTQLEAKYTNALAISDPSFVLCTETSASDPYDLSAKFDDAKTAEDIEIADVLGFDFSKPGQEPLKRTAYSLLDSLNPTSDSGNIFRAVDNKSLINRPDTLAENTTTQAHVISTLKHMMPYSLHRALILGNATSISSYPYLSILFDTVSKFSKAYELLALEGIVPDVQDLVPKALARVKEIMPDHEGDTVTGSWLDEGKYTAFISGNSVVPYVSQASVILGTFTEALVDSTCLQASTSNLAKRITEESGSNASTAVYESPYFINASDINQSLSSLRNLMSYFGGALLVEAADAMTSADHKAILNITRRSATQLKYGGKLSSTAIQNFVLPFAAIVGRYLPNVEDFFERAEEYVESITPVSELDPNDIALPGSKGFSFLPHQFEAQKHLIKRPKYAVLDIAPGGGKTILGITDIMHCAAQSGKRIRPVIVAPNGLVKNWCNDLKIATDSWNIIPITTDTMKRWEPDALVELITNSPRNTIVVLSNSFISNPNQSVKLNIAGAACRISSSVEFVVRMGFNYVMLDESHKAKNPDAQINRNLRRVFCAPSVEYKRIATGTLIVDKITDIVGQAALLTPALFGKGAAINPKLSVAELSNTENKEKAEEVAKTIASVRARIESYSVLITKRKKDWAFILPYPIDNFVSIPLYSPDAPDSDLHAEAYDLVRQSMQNDIEIEMRNTKKSKEEDEDEDEDDGEGSGEPEAEIQLIRDIQKNAVLRAKYDSMEMMVTAPASHQIAIQVFEAAGKDISKFIPYKLRVMGTIVKQHFETEKYDPSVWDDLENKRHRKFEWVKGCQPFELDLCMYKGKMYMARKKFKDKVARMRLPASEIAPDQDTDYWKPERSGKIIIICRYHTSIDAVVAAIPKEYRKNVVRFHGKRPPALNTEALERFDKDDTATIIVAMEQSISEGYNMQAGSRMIRIDNPWNSGTYEQTISRIMRPDMKSLNFDGGKPGDMAREVVNVDWLMTDGTIEVMKVALLQQKTVEAEMFYEKDNPLYAPMKDFLDLTPIDFDANTIFQNKFCWYGSYSTGKGEADAGFDRKMRHFDARSTLTGIQQKEFAEMRQDRPTSLVAVPAVAAPADFKVLRNLPVVPGQKPTNDAKNYGLVQFSDWYASFDWPDNKEQLTDKIRGTFVVTEYGNGRIINTSQLAWDKDPSTKKYILDPITGKKVLKSGVPFANLIVVIGKGRDARTVAVPTSVVFVAANIDKRTANAFLLDQPAVKAGKDSDKVDYEDDGSEVEVEVDTDTKSTRPSKGEAADAAQAKMEAKTKAEKKVDADNEEKSATVRETTRINKAIKDATAGGRRPKPSELPDIKPVSREVGELPDIKPVTRPEGKRPPKDTQAAPALDNKVDVRPMVYNGMIALYVNAAEGINEGALKTDGFLKFGEFMYCDVRNATDYFKVIDHFENVKKEGDEDHEFVLDSASEARLNHIQHAFEHKGTMKFNYMQAYAKRKDLIEFFQVQHRQVRATAADTHLKVYPAFLGDRVRLMIDLKTCPAAKRLLNVHYDGVPAPYGKWFKHQPMFVNLVSTVAQAKAALNKLSKLGLEVNDMPSVLKMLAKIQVKPQ